jgi:hypothetical protein
LAEDLFSNYDLQISSETRDMLKQAGGFNLIKRESTSPKLPEGLKTYWLIGLTGGADMTIMTSTNETSRAAMSVTGSGKQ